MTCIYLNRKSQSKWRRTTFNVMKIVTVEESQNSVRKREPPTEQVFCFAVLAAHQGGVPKIKVSKISVCVQSHPIPLAWCHSLAHVNWVPQKIPLVIPALGHQLRSVQGASYILNQLGVLSNGPHSLETLGPLVYQHSSLRMLATPSGLGSVNHIETLTPPLLYSSWIRVRVDNQAVSIAYESY